MHSTKLINRAPGCLPVSPQASLAAQLAWVVRVATSLQLLDDELFAMWVAGDITDYDLLENIATHGDLPRVRRSSGEGPQAALMMDRVNNLITGLTYNATGNFGG